ncbi:J domain-containing protein [Allorhizobium undicola]|uniref:J domain-containing protein n=1 Tax=Allorhizobium undicola TaxID=78527 RepID=UPI000483CCE8|nr:DnaJ domain-containing protein [Allorhizobium undicola]
MRDPYSILGVRRDADADEIKSAWRSKAKTAHPDQNQDDPDAGKRFAELGQAYDVLKDPQKRNRYDQRAARVESMKREQTIMQQREEARAAAERARQAKANAERVMAELARIDAEKARAEKAAEALMAKAEMAQAKAEAAQARATQAKDAQTRENQAKSSQPREPQGKETTAREAQARETQGRQDARPDAAKPSAASADATHPGDSETDDALSQIFDQRRDEPEKHPDGDHGSRGFLLPGFQLITSLVRLIRKPQPVQEKAPDITVEATIAVQDLLQHNPVMVQLSDGRELRVPLEAGLTDGSLVRLGGKGLKLPNMQPGDVLVTLRVLKSGPLAVDGFDLRCSLPLALQDAVLGCECEVEGPEGPVKITVPAWASTEQPLRVEALGLPRGDGTRGDLLVDIRISLQESPDDKITDLMRLLKHGLYL